MDFTVFLSVAALTVTLSVEGVNAIRVQVRFSGYIAASLNCREKIMDMASGATVQDLLSQLDLPVSSSWVAAVMEGKVRDKKTPLKEGDEVLILPLGGGG